MASIRASRRVLVRGAQSDQEAPKTDFLFLVFVIYGTAVDSRAPRVGGLFIGLTVTLDILIGGPLTGAAMNPARHLGPALLGGGLQNLWLYWVGPLAGGIAAALVYRHVLEEKG